MANERIASSPLSSASSRPETLESALAPIAPGETVNDEIPGEFDIGTSTLWPSAGAAGPQKESLAGKIGTFFLMVYFGGVGLAFPYFTWNFIKEHTFLEWLCFGEFVPFGKALIWPYYVGGSLLEKGLTQDEKENLAHFKRGGIARYKATILLEGFAKKGKLIPTDFSRVLDLLKEALDESNLLRDDVLAKIHVDLPKMYREKYVAPLARLLQLIEAGWDDVQECARMERLAVEWENWVMDHKNDLRILLE
jgi:hypothetical protein